MESHETTLLLRAARAGSREALDRLFERCAPRLLALIRLRLGRELRGHLESRDILQASLLKSFQRIDQLEQSDARSLMAWLARIAENEVKDRVDYHRRQRRDARQEVPLDERDGDLVRRVRSSLSQVIFDERARRLEQALESLPEQHREVIVLRKLEELSWAEVARRLGRSDDACRMLLARAMASLTMAMSERR